MDPLVSVEWLLENTNRVKLVDASWRMPGSNPARIDYEKRHIPGAHFFDIDEIADPDTDLPHMLPSPQAFANAMRAMGISNENHVVIYDDKGIFSAPHAWWVFRVMGHKNVSVLDGGLPRWISFGGVVSSEKPNTRRSDYTALMDASIVSDHHSIRAAFTAGDIEIVDARPRERFLGQMAEPRPALLSGAMPTAKNIPFSTVLNDNGCMKSVEELKAVFSTADIALDSSVIATCGSGITAAIIALALSRLGHEDWSLYDGSWAEWGKESNDRVEYPVLSENE